MMLTVSTIDNWVGGDEGFLIDMQSIFSLMQGKIKAV